MIREVCVPIPGETCCGCSGRGFHLSYGQGRACYCCEGHATAGVFVVQVSSGEVVRELNDQTECFRSAVATAIRAATLASLLVRRVRVTEARVAYCSGGAPAKVVYRVPVSQPETDTVAA